MGLSSSSDHSVARVHELLIHADKQDDLKAFLKNPTTDPRIIRKCLNHAITHSDNKLLVTILAILRERFESQNTFKEFFHNYHRFIMYRPLDLLQRAHKRYDVKLIKERQIVINTLIETPEVPCDINSQTYGTPLQAAIQFQLTEAINKLLECRKPLGCNNAVIERTVELDDAITLAQLLRHPELKNATQGTYALKKALLNTSKACLTYLLSSATICYSPLMQQQIFLQKKGLDEQKKIYRKLQELTNHTLCACRQCFDPMRKQLLMMIKKPNNNQIRLADVSIIQ
jgi:hypothetical protein